MSGVWINVELTVGPTPLSGFWRTCLLFVIMSHSHTPLLFILLFAFHLFSCKAGEVSRCFLIGLGPSVSSIGDVLPLVNGDDTAYSSCVLFLQSRLFLVCNCCVLVLFSFLPRYNSVFTVKAMSLEVTSYKEML